MDKYQLAKQKGIYQIDNRDKKINNYVAIFDIDDTIFNTKTNKLIDSIHELYQYALKNNVYVIFITARDGSGINKDLSIQQLKSLGLSYDLLYSRPPYMDVKKYKKYARKNVIDTGYKPLFSIGDMNWDIGEYGGFGILI